METTHSVEYIIIFLKSIQNIEQSSAQRQPKEYQIWIQNESDCQQKGHIRAFTLKGKMARQNVLKLNLIFESFAFVTIGAKSIWLILTHRAKMYWNLIYKSSVFVPNSANLSSLLRLW